MAKRWSDVSASAEFQALSYEDKEAARRQYFESVVAPQVGPEDLEEARSQFDSSTAIEIKPARESTAGSGRGMAEDPRRLDRQPRGGKRNEVRPYVAGDDRVTEPEQPEQQVIGDVTPAMRLNTPQPPGAESPATLQAMSRSPAAQAADQATAVGEAKRDRFLRESGNLQAAPEPGIVGRMLASTIAKPFDNSLAGLAVEAAGDAARGVGRASQNLGSSAWSGIQAIGNTVGADTVADFAGAAAKAGREALTTNQNTSDPNSLTQQVFESTFTSVPLIALGGAALPAMVAQSAAADYGKSLDRGLSHEDALARASWMGVAEGVGERFGLPQLSNLFRQAAERAGPKAFAKTLADLLWREQIGEQVTLAMQQGYEATGPYGTKPNMTLEQYLEDAANTVAVTAGQSLLTGGLAAGMGRMAKAAPAAPATLADLQALAVSKGFSGAPVTPAAPAETTFSDPTGPAAQAGIRPIVVPNVAPGTAQVPASVAAPENVNADVEAAFGLDTLRQGVPNVGVSAGPAGLAAGGGAAAGGDAAAGVAGAGQDAAVGRAAGPEGDVAQPGAAAPVATGERTGEPGPALSKPDMIWSGRAGDGYATRGDAEQAMPSRQRREPGLTWTVAQQPNGKFVLEGRKPATMAPATAADSRSSPSGLAAPSTPNPAAVAPQGAADGQQAPSVPPSGQATGRVALGLDGANQEGNAGQGDVRVGQTPAGSQAGSAGQDFAAALARGVSLAQTAPPPVLGRAQRYLLNDRKVAATAKTTGLTPEQVAATALGKALGRTVTILKTSKPAATPNGWVMRDGENDLFVADDSDDTPLAIVAHEATHSMSAPLRTKFVTAMNGALDQTKRQQFAEKYGYDANNAEEIDKEMAAFAMQALVKQPETWREIAKRVKKADFIELSKFILQKLDSIIRSTSQAYGEGFVKEYIKDVQRAREIVAEAMADAEGDVATEQDVNADDAGVVASERAKNQPRVDNFEVSTRAPWAKRGEIEDSKANLLISDFSSGRGEAGWVSAVTELATQYPNYRAAVTANADEKKLERLIRHMTDNLLWLHDKVPAKTRERSKLWYDGANAIATRMSRKYGLSLPQASGILAALSPQKDWFMNVSLAERVAQIMAERQAFMWSTEMEATSRRIFGKAQYDEDLDAIRGSQLQDLDDDYLRAMWVRVYDEAHNPRSFMIVSPEGDFVAEARAKTGKAAKVAWGGTSTIAKAVTIFERDDVNVISESLGRKHKVRNFYNNILVPNSPNGHVTIDTHAVAAALLRALSGNSIEVKHNFGGPSNANVGLQGTYALYEEAYHRAAEARGILPREMQSITWEAVRGMYVPGFKSQQKNVDAVDAVWTEFAKGRLSHEKARDQVLELAGGIVPPSWDGRDPGAYVEDEAAADEGDVPGDGVPRRRARSAAGRARGDDSRAAARDDGERAGDGGPSYSRRVLAPLEGAPNVQGAAGPDARLVEVAERYAASRGITLRRQAEYVKVDEERAARIAKAYDAMAHAPADPKVRAAYADLISQTRAQYDALVEAGYNFWFMNPEADPYGGNPWNAMRDLRANQSMAVFPSEAGFGSSDLDVGDNPLLADTGLRWAYGAPDGKRKRVLANDLFRAVHDAFGHGLEGAGFRAQGEENAWQAHVRLFTGAAVGAITSETRGQNSWLNYGPYGEKNRTAGLEDTVFADQKTGLMPAWTWEEGRAGDGDITASNRAPDLNPLGLYSGLARALEKGPNQAPADQWKAFLKGLPSKGIKQDEITWSGIEEWLGLQTGKVPREAVLEYLRQGGVRVEEVVLGDVDDSDMDAYQQDDNSWNIKRISDGAFIINIRGYKDDPEGAIEAAKRSQHGNLTKYSQYTLPGGENYREVLLTLPAAPRKPRFDVVSRKDKSIIHKAESSEAAQAWIDSHQGMPAARGAEVVERAGGQAVAPEYKSNHWDHPNIIAHIRLNDRTDVDGSKVMFVEELQSDYGADARKKGIASKYKPADVVATEGPNPEMFWYFNVPDNTFQIPKSKHATQEAARDYIIREKKVNSGGVPAAPFIDKTSAWLDLALKRVITMAVRGGYDKVAFVTGEQSAERYDLSKQVGSVRWAAKQGADDGKLTVKDLNGNVVLRERTMSQMKASELEDFVGKDVARKLLESQPKSVTPHGDEIRELSGLDLKVGGEGMKAFYNTIVPNAAKALAKKLGGEWGSASIEAPDRDAGPVSGVDVMTWMGIPRNEMNSFWAEADHKELIEKYRNRNKKAGGIQQPALNITMPMRQKVQDEGLPLFSNRVQPDGRIDNIEAYHFSQAPRQTLSTAFFGTGLRGSDRDEIKAYKDQRVGKRLSFYVDKGTGVRPESGVGGVAHRVTLSNVYDSDKDPQGLKKVANKRAFEAAVLDAGFSGYLTRLEGTQPGQVIMLGEQTFKPEILGPTSSIAAGQRVEPMPQKANDWDTLDTGSADQMRVKMERLQSKPRWADFEFRIQDGQLQARRLEAVAASNRVTDTAKFKYWFGDSKVVDAGGDPLVVYHGTNQDVTRFDPERVGDNFGVDEEGFFFTSSTIRASGYADPKSELAAAGLGIQRGDEPRSGANVMPVYLSLQNPLTIERYTDAFYTNASVEIDEQGISLTDYFDDNRKSVMDFVKLGKHDGVLFQHKGKTLAVALRPNQIKSAIGNSGAFDPNDHDITASNRVVDKLFPKDGLGRRTLGPTSALYRMVANFANKVLEPIGLKPIDEDLGRAIRKMKLEISKAQARTADVAVKLKELSEDERKMISDVIEGELKAGVTPPQRVLDIATSMVSIMREQSNELVRLGMLTPEAVGRWDGKYLPRFYVKDLKSQGKEWMRAAKQLLGRQKTMQGIGGSSLKARGIFENIATADLPNWEAQGWEQRDPKFTAGDAETVVWRDYTRQERDDMNEVRDAMFRFVMGYMRSQRDIALGRLFERLAVDVAKKAPPKGQPWVQVPDTKIDGTYAPRYGKLAGLFVPREVLDHLKAADSAQTNEILKIYRKAMSMWKEGKVVLNPVSHANNIVSNLTMAHFAGVSYWDQHKYVGAIRDLVKKDPLVKEAEDAGLFGGTFNSEELMDNMPDELKELAGQVESKAAKAVDGVWTALSFWLRKPMGKAYEAEDTFFRYLIYRDARKRGMQPDDAVDYAQRYIFAYDDLPATARGIRDFALPFFAYTYKAIPALAHTVMHYPWRAAAPAAVFAGINTMGYIFAVGATDDEDDWYELIKRYITDKDFSDRVKALEAQEQESLPEWMKGYSALGTPKSIRLGMDDVTNLPLFLDVARIFPGGDLLDANNNAGGIPLLQPITPSHPILNIYGAMYLNKDGYFGKEIVDKNDTSGEAFEKRAKWAWGQLAPAIAIGNYHFDRGMNVIAQVTGEPIDIGVTEYLGYGRDGLPVQPSLAAMQTVGIKARPIDLEKSDAIKQSQTEKMIRDLQTEIRRLQRIDSNLPVSSKLNERQIELNRTKIDRLREGLTVDGEEKK